MGGERVRLLKPQTFMNASGESVGETARFFKLLLSDIIVIHDEIDLRPGKMRVKCGGGNAGHNGLRSIDALLAPDYWRVGVGGGHPRGEENFYAFVFEKMSLWGVDRRAEDHP